MTENLPMQAPAALAGDGGPGIPSDEIRAVLRDASRVAALVKQHEELETGIPAHCVLVGDTRRAVVSRLTVLTSSFQAVDKALNERAIRTMLTGLRQKLDGGEAGLKGVIAPYLMAVGGQPSWAVVRAAKRFMQGMVPGAYLGAPPTTAEFAQDVRGVVKPFEDEARALSMLLQIKEAPAFEAGAARRPLPNFELKRSPEEEALVAQERQGRLALSSRANDAALAREHAHYGTNPEGPSPGLLKALGRLS